jgi:methionine-gamma-lyase
MKKYGGMIAFQIKGGFNEAMKLMDNLQLCTLAVSLGDCDTLISHPASTTSSSYSEEEMRKSGITPNLVRLSVGIEDVTDIMDDLNQALRKI